MGEVHGRSPGRTLNECQTDSSKSMGQFSNPVESPQPVQAPRQRSSQFNRPQPQQNMFGGGSQRNPTSNQGIEDPFSNRSTSAGRLGRFGRPGGTVCYNV